MPLPSPSLRPLYLLVFLVLWILGSALLFFMLSSYPVPPLWALNSCRRVWDLCLAPTSLGLAWQIAFLSYLTLACKIEYAFCLHTATISYIHLDPGNLFHQHKTHRSNACWESVLHIRADQDGSVNSVDRICPKQQISYAWLRLPHFACCELALPFYEMYFVTVQKKYTRLIRVGTICAYFCSYYCSGCFKRLKKNPLANFVPL